MRAEASGPFVYRSAARFDADVEQLDARGSRTFYRANKYR
jgi:hypothetical protein